MTKDFVYLMAVLHVYTHYVVHWSLSNTMPAEWCADTLKEAVAKEEKPMLMNTDQSLPRTLVGGSQFTGKAFINVLKKKECKSA
jgi:putative transposase